MDWVLVRTYNFDPEIRVWGFPTEDEAISEMVRQYERDLETERHETELNYDEEDREDHGVYEEKCFCDKEIGTAHLAWKNDCTWNIPDEYDYCEWRVQRLEER